MNSIATYVHWEIVRWLADHDRAFLLVFEAIE